MGLRACYSQNKTYRSGMSPFLFLFVFHRLSPSLRYTMPPITNSSEPTHLSKVLSFKLMLHLSASGMNHTYVLGLGLMYGIPHSNLATFQYAQPITKRGKAAPVTQPAETEAEVVKLSNHAQRSLDARKKGKVF